MLDYILSTMGAFGGGGLTAALLTAHLSDRRESRTDTRTQVRQATTGLRDALASVREVTARTPPMGAVDARTVVETMVAWGGAFERWNRWLPRSNRHIDHSVSDAVSEHLGLVGVAHRLPNLDDEEFADNLDIEWQEKATGYIDHVIVWLDDSNRDGRWVGHLHTFTEWLSARAGREADLQHGYYSRTDGVLGRLLGGPRP